MEEVKGKRESKEAEEKKSEKEEENPPKPYRSGEIWWVPITDGEWKEWHGEETYKCKEGGWWTKMTDEKFEQWQFWRDSGRRSGE